MTQTPRTLFAVHGAGMHAGIWGQLLPLLAEVPFQAVSLPGHDAAGGAVLGSIEEMADWLRARLAGYDADSVVLIGHSMGALAALEAASHPAVAAVILMGAAGRMPVHPDLLNLAASDPAAAGEMILKWGLDPARPDIEDMKAYIRKLMQAGAVRAIFADLKACDIYKHGAEKAAALQKPLLVICGDKDKLTKAADGLALADMAPFGESSVLADCGHMMMAERPAETAALIRKFLEKLE